MTKTFMNFWIYIYPFPALYFFYQYWSGLISSEFALYLILVPTLYGYIMPGIAVNILKKWKFNTPFRIGNYYAHHGFKIAANINTSYFLTTFAAHSLLPELTSSQRLLTAIAVGCVHGFIIWWHDTILIKLGKLELHNDLVSPSMSPEEKAYSYAPATFFIMGFTYALSSFAALDIFQKEAPSLGSLIGVIIGGFILVSFSGSVVFGMLEVRARKKKKSL